MKNKKTKQNTVKCPTCNGHGWLNANEQCPVCRGNAFIPVMARQEPKKQNSVKCPTCNGQAWIGNEQCPVCRGNGYLPVMPEPKKYPVIQQQPEQVKQTTVYPERQGNDLHIFFHTGAMEYQQAGTDTQRAAAMPVSGAEPKGGISIFQICCIGAVILALMTWGGAL